MGVTLVIYCFSESGAYICSGTYLISACVSAGSGRSVSNTANISTLVGLLSSAQILLFFSPVVAWQPETHYKTGPIYKLHFFGLEIISGLN